MYNLLHIVQIVFFDIKWQGRLCTASLVFLLISRSVSSSFCFMKMTARTLANSNTILDGWVGTSKVGSAMKIGCLLQYTCKCSFKVGFLILLWIVILYLAGCWFHVGWSEVGECREKYIRAHRKWNPMGIDSGISGKVCYNCLANPINLHNDDSTHFFFRNPVEYIEFLMELPAFREHMSYAPAKVFIHAEKRIYSEVKSINWWWKEEVC